MAGVKGRSGRKRAIGTLVAEAMTRVDQNLPAIFDALVARALQGDKDCLIYLIDRRLGRPRQEIAASVKASIAVSADEYELASRIQVLDDRKLLGNGTEYNKDYTLPPEANGHLVGSQTGHCMTRGNEASHDAAQDIVEVETDMEVPGRLSGSVNNTLTGRENFSENTDLVDITT